ncbi:MAG: cytochrome c [Candidatus Eremiobacterota bacterium]
MNRTILGTVTLLLLWGCGSPPTPPETPAATTPAVTTPAPAATTAAADVKGKADYDGTCSACHGPDGKGVQGLGKPLVGSAMLKLSDQELLAFVNKGRDVSDPGNTTGIAMPPKGGNPALTDAQITDIIGYMRSLK